jgi:hypothetical protein
MVLIMDIDSPPGLTISAKTVGGGWYDAPLSEGGTQLRAGFVQMWLDDIAGTFESGSTTDQAVTLLHELGHIYSDLFGPQSTAIQNDGTSAQASQANTNLLKTTCFH